MHAHETHEPTPEVIARPPVVAPGTVDDRVILHGITWDQYETILAIRGEAPCPRIAYLEGELELMSPSRSHESIKTCLARMVEAYADERGLNLEGLGSMTMKERPKERGVEPDECYEIDGPKEFPDLAIEVVWTRGGLDKLEIYRAFGVREVWVWRDGAIEVHALRGAAYERIGRSELFPELDVAAMAVLASRRDQSAAVREFRRMLREK